MTNVQRDIQRKLRAPHQSITDECAAAVIPSKSNAPIPNPHGPELYAVRNLVEQFFCRHSPAGQDMRRLTDRYEKLKINLLAMVDIFAIRYWQN